jgi:hypothetical protein
LLLCSYERVSIVVALAETCVKGLCVC